jgi:hypothetical protein
MFSVFSIGSPNRKVLKESWAEGVETIVTNDRYFSLTPFYSSTTNDNGGRWNSSRQDDAAINMNAYTPIVDDLIDIRNQGLNNSNLPFDNVSGYTLNQIQNALDGSREPSDWHQALDVLNIANSNDLKALFTYVYVASSNIR